MKAVSLCRRHLAGLLVVCSLFLAACGREAGADTVSAGQIDNVNGFLFIFDNRSVQQQLVRDMEDGRIPKSLICERYLIERDYENGEKESLVEEATIRTEDASLIRSVYHAMTDMIVVGQIGMQDNTYRCRITFILEDGTPCVFDFETVSIIRIVGQNYVIESDGRLWNLLPIFGEEEKSAAGLGAALEAEEAATDEDAGRAGIDESAADFR